MSIGTDQLLCRIAEIARETGFGDFKALGAWEAGEFLDAGITATLLRDLAKAHVIERARAPRRYQHEDRGSVWSGYLCKDAEIARWTLRWCEEYTPTKNAKVVRLGADRYMAVCSAEDVD